MYGLQVAFLEILDLVNIVNYKLVQNVIFYKRRKINRLIIQLCNSFMRKLIYLKVV